jgi:hypothetical protein
MNETKPDFSELKRLLKLKRHEVPPPGFFNHFSEEVVARIRAGEARGQNSVADRLQEHAPWLVNFLRVFEAKPGLIGGFAASLCLLLVLGVVLAEHSENSPQNVFATAATDPSSGGVASAASTATEFASVGTSEGGIAISTNASLQPVASLFGQPNGTSLFQPASFAPAH